MGSTAVVVVAVVEKEKGRKTLQKDREKKEL